ncbi:hypothetical protein [Campylobacter geochelonis]|uniref:Ricin-type beta-trefoil lectin domain n=1 Tax=Campylobacter geochelonis TaxID=1780362 RepID=A0A128EL90_9BACT|nr:hypothetical protein [Campylobacter geochelonis]QKF71571.1 hypothetical protein CGEO_1275 [Campylobacter geochelonis]CZE48737.1 Ricin-type beta-trefoil lectin domain [Campylobacter geochelonis]CZE49128.1 Ricin-type beta-trefoil lectin domain [Campylobacter geochelonis]CZE51328.1 Ricin-type beta-trefoil lectin domain [Campylobacter geochelonis]
MRLFLLLFIAVFAFAKEPHHIKLVDNLDRKSDGYCLDVLGSGRYIRYDMPLQGHNCKPGLYADEAFVFENEQIYSPVTNMCVTIAGVNNSVLDYTPLVLQPCSLDSAFVNAKFMQAFEFTKNQKIKHKYSDMCLEMGESSDSTFSKEHTWRTLYMKNCDKVDTARSTWKFDS